MMPQRNALNQMEQLFEQFTDVTPAVQGEWSTSWNDFKVDIAESQDGESVVVTADIPGYSKDEVTVNLNGRKLTIGAERNGSQEETDEETYIHRERQYQSVQRTIKLPTEVKKDEVTAEYSNGVLSVTLPKQQSETVTGTEIEIN